jgi:hypothetical protein
VGGVAWDLLSALASPPMVGCLLAVAVGMTRPLRDALFEPGGSLLMIQVSRGGWQRARFSLWLQPVAVRSRHTCRVTPTPGAHACRVPLFPACLLLLSRTALRCLASVASPRCC